MLLSNASQHIGQEVGEVKKFTSEVPSSFKSKGRHTKLSMPLSHTSIRHLFSPLNSSAHLGKREGKKFPKPLCLLAAYFWALNSEKRIQHIK